jgi:hypothetical protein
MFCRESTALVPPPKKKTKKRGSHGATELSSSVRQFGENVGSFINTKKIACL